MYRQRLTSAAERVVSEVTALAAIHAASAVCSSAGLARQKFAARNLGDSLLGHERNRLGSCGWGGAGRDEGDGRSDSEEGSGELHGESGVEYKFERLEDGV